mgnify:CR=1 FL=1
MVTFLGFASKAELIKAWKSSGVAFLTVAALVAALQYAQGILAQQGATSLAAGLGSALVAQLIVQARALQDGLPPPTNSLPNR